jgi:hypothetical protein
MELIEDFFVLIAKTLNLLIDFILTKEYQHLMLQLTLVRVLIVALKRDKIIPFNLRKSDLSEKLFQ